MSQTRRAVFNRVISLIERKSAAETFSDAGALLREAERRTGKQNWGDPHFRDGLDALLASLVETPGLTPLGVLTFRSIILQSLVNRLRFLDEDIARRPLQPPVIITGLPRSGTTILHRLIALDPAHHAPQLWELLDPFSGTPDTYRRWRARAQVAVKVALLKDLDRKHYTRATTEEECTLLLINSFATSLFWDMAPLERYLQWYQSSSRTQPYTEYRRQLEIMQALHPEHRLVLKAPGHLGNIAAFHEAVPEALLIQTHRNPTDCFFSHCSLRETLTQFVIDHPDPEVIADSVARVFDHDLRRNIEFNSGQPDRVHHVPQSGLRSSALETVSSIYDRIGLEFSTETGHAVEAYLERNRRGRFGAHRVSEERYGVSRPQVDEMFEVYRETFGWALED